MYELTVFKINEDACRQAITFAVLAVDGNASLNFDMDTSRVAVNSVATLAEVSDAIEAAGYHIELAAQNDSHGADGHHCDMCD